MDNQKANGVYDLVYSDEPIAAQVKGALEVIDQALDDFECVRSFGAKRVVFIEPLSTKGSNILR